MSSADNPLQTFWTQIRPDILSGHYQGPDPHMTKCFELLFRLIVHALFSRQWLEVRIRTPSIFYHVRLQVQTYNPDEKLS